MASMDSENRKNPRNLVTATKVVAIQLAPQKQTQTILDRFKAQLRQREEELRGSAEDNTVSPPSAEEILLFYDLLLSELTFNSKPIVTDLKIIAGDQKEHGKGIAEAICARILELPVEQKLPPLYLLGSIVNNIGREYVTCFSSCLPEVFCEAFKQVHPNQHNTMQHRFGTCSAVFPPSVHRKNEAQPQLYPSANHQSSALTESSRPNHGIHANPKYLHQFEHSTVDGNIQQARTTSALKPYGQKPPIGYDEFDMGQAELVSSQAGDPKLRLTGNAVEEFAADHSSRRLADRSSTVYLKFEYGQGTATDGDEEKSGLHGKYYAGSNHTRFETKTIYDVSNGHGHQQSRALIDADGNDTLKKSFNDKPLHGQCHDMNCTDNKAVTPSWQNTEEEEFDWEDMSRPLVDRRRSNDFLSTSVPPFGRISVRPAFGVWRASPLEANQAQLPAVESSLPTVHNSHLLPLQPIFSQMKQMSQSESINGSNNVYNRDPNGYLYMPDQQLNGFGNKELSSMKLSQLPNQRAGPISLSQQNQVQVTPLQPQFLPSQGVHSSLAAVVPPHLVALRLNHGYNPHMQGAAVSTVLSKPVTGAQLMLPVQNTPSSSLHLQGGTLPPLPPSVPRTPSQMIPLTPNAVPVVCNQQTSISGLIGSLMAQGLISLTRPTPVQDSMGVEFNADLLKVRHESAISALYTDLPRQCTTCGLRFKCQEEHSSHMDWHVTKNRMYRSLKQKPSRKWFVSASMWLSGAEALGSEAVFAFLPTEVIVEKKDEGMAVPADDDQNACALCGDPFDDFYSDETEEWMYKGAVYLNMPSGLTAGMDRSQLGPIVHAKCRSDSSAVSPGDCRQDERGITAEGSQSKRMRLS